MHPKQTYMLDAASKVSTKRIDLNRFYAHRRMLSELVFKKLKKLSKRQGGISQGGNARFIKVRLAGTIQGG